MPTLTDLQLQGLASPVLDAGTSIDPNWPDPYPDAPCWAWALFGAGGGNADNTPPIIFEQALQLNSSGVLTGLRPGFLDWVQTTFQNPVATAQATLLEENFQEALVNLDGDAQLACTCAFARLCIAVAGLTATDEPSNYAIVMASDHWYTWEHWALSLTNNLNEPLNPPVQYTQRYPVVKPVSTRCAQVWGEHPILTAINIEQLQPGHLDYLQHAVGWP